MKPTQSVYCAAQMPQRQDVTCELTSSHDEHRAWPDVNLGGSYSWTDGDTEAHFETEATYE